MSKKLLDTAATIDYINWNSAMPELLDLFMVIDAYRDRAYVRDVVKTDRFQTLNAACAERNPDHKKINEFVDLCRGLCDAILSEETKLSGENTRSL